MTRLLYKRWENLVLDNPNRTLPEQQASYFSQRSLAGHLNSPIICEYQRVRVADISAWQLVITWLLWFLAKSLSA